MTPADLAKLEPKRRVTELQERYKSAKNKLNAVDRPKRINFYYGSTVLDVIVAIL